MDRNISYILTNPEIDEISKIELFQKSRKLSSEERKKICQYCNCLDIVIDIINLNGYSIDNIWSNYYLKDFIIENLNDFTDKFSLLTNPALIDFIFDNNLKNFLEKNLDIERNLEKFSLLLSLNPMIIDYVFQYPQGIETDVGHIYWNFTIIENENFYQLFNDDGEFLVKDIIIKSSDGFKNYDEHDEFFQFKTDYLKNHKNPINYFLKNNKKKEVFKALTQNPYMIDFINEHFNEYEWNINYLRLNPNRGNFIHKKLHSTICFNYYKPTFIKNLF